MICGSGGGEEPDKNWKRKLVIDYLPLFAGGYGMKGIIIFS